MAAAVAVAVVLVVEAFTAVEAFTVVAVSMAAVSMVAHIIVLPTAVGPDAPLWAAGIIGGTTAVAAAVLVG